MKESIIGFVNDIANLDEREKANRIADFVEMQIENFILWNWSDDKERERELKNLKVWLVEDDR